MGVTYSLHARQRMVKRGITETDIEYVLRHHHTTHPDLDGNPCFIGTIGERRLHVVVSLGSDPPHIVTVIWLD